MLTGHDIIYLAGHDFNLSDCKISTDHIAEQLSTHNRILYVESIGIRRPRFNRNDMKRIFSKLRRLLLPLKKVRDNFYVATPIVVPFHHLKFVQLINGWILILCLRAMCLVLRFKKPLLFIFLPSMGKVVGKLGEVLAIYYCTDEHAAFPGVDGNAMKKMEEDLLKKVRLGFATSPQILDAKKKINPSFYLSIHGVDYNSFAQAQDPGLPVPEDVTDLRKPIIGYFGAIDTWMDFDLVEYLSKSRKDWTFLFIGKPVVNLSKFAALANVHFIGYRPFHELPRYGRIFDVAIIPFLVNELTEYVFPVKLKEYLSMGKPVVSSALPPVVRFGKENPNLVEIGLNERDFLSKIEYSLSTDTDQSIKHRQNFVRKDTWERRLGDIGSIIEKNLSL